MPKDESLTPLLFIKEEKEKPLHVSLHRDYQCCCTTNTTNGSCVCIGWGDTFPLFLSFIYWLVGWMGMGIIQAANYDRRYHQSPQQYLLLPDLIHDHTSRSFADISLLHEIGIFAPAGLVYVCVIGTHVRWPVLTRRLFLLWGTMFYMRWLTVPMTSYPDPSEGCKGDDPLGQYSNPYVASFMYMASCGDLIFSGHTTLAVTTFLMSLFAYPLRFEYIPLHVFTLFLCCSGIAIVGMTRLHYTTDIIVAIYLTFLAFGQYWETLQNPRYNQIYEKTEENEEKDYRERCCASCCTFWEKDRYTRCRLCHCKVYEGYCYGYSKQLLVVEFPCGEVEQYSSFLPRPISRDCSPPSLS